MLYIFGISNPASGEDIRDPSCLRAKERLLIRHAQSDTNPVSVFVRHSHKFSVRQEAQ